MYHLTKYILEIIVKILFLFFIAENTTAITHKESGPFEQEHLIGIDDVGKVDEVGLELFDVGNEEVDDRGPGLVEGLIPDGCPETGAVQGLG